MLRRRRRRRVVLAALTIAAAAVGAATLAYAIGASPGSAGSGRVSVSVSFVTLPKTRDYLSLAVVNGRLLVSGGAHGSLLDSDATTDIAHGRAAWTCDSASVDPVTLRLSELKRGNCGDPALYGERVLAVTYVDRVPTPSGVWPMQIRIARADPSARDGYRLGPVVATFPQCSDCWPQWIYGDGSLWIYDQFAGPGFAQNGELLRVSESTGAVAQRWSMPSIARPLVAVDADGCWLAPSNESGWPEHVPRSRRIRYQSLYHVWPGAHAPARVLPVGGGSGALWLVAGGHTVWLEADRHPKRATLWRLTGKNAKATLLGAYPAGSTQGGEYGEGAPSYAGNAAAGIYYVANPYRYTVDPRAQQIFRLAPDAPVEQRVATVTGPTSELYASPPAGVALGRSFYFLDPPTISSPGGNAPPSIRGTARLYRVTSLG